MNENNRQKHSTFRHAGILLALILPLLTACGGGGGGGEIASDTSLSAPSTVAPPVDGTAPTDGTSSSSIAWTDRLYGQGVPHKLIWNGAGYVGVGGPEGFQISDDSKVWRVTSRWSKGADIAWDGTIYVVPGSGLSNGLYTSSDGKTWTSRQVPDSVKSVAFSSVAKSNAMWVAVGAEGTIIYSTDATNWTVAPAITVNSPTPDLRAVTWTGSQFIAVGDSGVVVTSPNGMSWTVQQSPTTNRFVAIASHGGLTVAATIAWPGPAAALMTSTDGVNWTEVSPLGVHVNSIVHAGGKWVVAGWYKSMTSTDGETWTESPRTVGIFSSVIHNGKEYVATGTDWSGVGAVFASSDGLNWNTRNITAKLTAAAVSPDGRMVAVGVSDSSRTSMDGVTWELGHLASNYPFMDITWSPKLASFVGLVQIAANQDIYTSTDGKNWQAQGAAPCGSGATVIASTEIIVNAGNPFRPCLATSVDGVSWQTQVAPWTNTAAPTKGFWTGSQFIVVGTNGLIFTSPDGATWTSRTSNTTKSLYGAAVSPSKIVVVGNAGTILTSADNGVTWTPQTSGTTLTLHRAVWTGSEFYAVGIGAAVLKSADGVTWSKVTTLYSDWSNIQSPPSFGDVLVSSSGRVVIFGSEGLVATIP